MSEQKLSVLLTFTRPQNRLVWPTIEGWKRVENARKETIGDEVERRPDFACGRETRSQGNASGPGQLGEGIL